MSHLINIQVCLAYSGSFDSRHLCNSPTPWNFEAIDSWRANDNYYQFLSQATY